MDIIKRKCKRWWSTMPLISTKECLCLFQASTWISNVVSDFEVRGDCLFCWYWWNCWPSWHTPSFHNNISHRIIEYKEDHWLNLFMFCKQQHGKLEGIQYLLSSKAWQVVECAYLDWCNLIRIQITTKYKIRTK